MTGPRDEVRPPWRPVGDLVSTIVARLVVADDIDGHET